MLITLKDIVDEDFVNYKKPSMFLIFPNCTFKCDKENGNKICQNSSLVREPNVKIEIAAVVNRYCRNSLSHSIVCGGLEPFDSWKELLSLICELRKVTEDDIIIYTGYKEEEITERINQLAQFPNIIIKFGRFIPNQSSHLDAVLGINLASPNQYARRIS